MEEAMSKTITLCLGLTVSVAVLVLLFAGCGGSTSTGDAPSQQFQQAQAAFREEIVSELQNAAARANIDIIPESIIALPMNDTVVFANAMIRGYERLTVEQAAQGADAMFIYLSEELRSANQVIEPGFYIVRISRDSEGRWIAQLRNSQGAVIFQTSANVGAASPNASRIQPMCTIGPRGELILFDTHDPFKDTVLEIAYRSAEGTSDPKPSTIRLRQAVRNYLLAQDLPQDVRASIARSNVVPIVVSPAHLGSENKPILLNCNPAGFLLCWCERTDKPEYILYNCVGIDRNYYIIFVPRD